MVAMPANRTTRRVRMAIATKAAPKWSACATSAKGDHRAGQDGQEHVHASKGFGVGERTGGEQAPVLGGEDLKLRRRRRCGRRLHYLRRYFCGLDEVRSISFLASRSSVTTIRCQPTFPVNMPLEAAGQLVQQLGVCDLLPSQGREDGRLERLVVALRDRLVDLTRRVFRQYSFGGHSVSAHLCDEQRGPQSTPAVSPLRPPPRAGPLSPAGWAGFATSFC